VFCDLVRKWNPRINLVSAATLDHLDSRHLQDSAQVAAYLPPVVKHLVDVGSGGGFPGLVLAAILADREPTCQVSLVEVDARKATFLREAARHMGLRIEVHNRRVEDIGALDANVVTARALAPLSRLLNWCVPHLARDGTLLLPKGRGYEDEVANARTAGWDFLLDIHASVTGGGGVILCLSQVARRGESTC
jgi:16S rRNA (guanine527-N7)-methyltransferase